MKLLANQPARQGFFWHRSDVPVLLAFTAQGETIIIELKANMRNILLASFETTLSAPFT